MKKLLAVFLALIMILSVSLVACSDKKEKEPSGEEVEDDVFLPNNTTGTTGTTTGGDDEDPEGTNPPSSAAWVNTSGTIYIRADNVAVRRDMTSKTEDIITKVAMGTSFAYDSYNNEWYKINYNGNAAYISKKHATINQDDVIFGDHATVIAGTKLTLTGDMNLRKAPAVADDTTICTLSPASVAVGNLTLISINKSGSWVKVHYTGSDKDNKKTLSDAEAIYYINTQYIKEFSDNSSGDVLG